VWSEEADQQQGDLSKRLAAANAALEQVGLFVGMTKPSLNVAVRCKRGALGGGAARSRLHVLCSQGYGPLKTWAPSSVLARYYPLRCVCCRHMVVCSTMLSNVRKMEHHACVNCATPVMTTRLVISTVQATNNLGRAWRTLLVCQAKLTATGLRPLPAMCNTHTARGSKRRSYSRAAPERADRSTWYLV